MTYKNLMYVPYVEQNIMQSFKFITFTDVHISSINPSSRKGSYEQDMFSKLEQIKDIGKNHNVDFFICAGDLYNLKAPMRNPHELNVKLINLFKSYHAPIYMTEGNHDLRNDSYETFNEQPLKVVYASDAVIQARDIKKSINGISLCIRSIPFEEEPDLSVIDRAPDGVDVSIFIMHLYATPDGGMLFKTKLYSYEEIANLKDDIYVMGHYHADQGIQTLNKNGKDQYFVNVGAVSRGALSEEETKRIPKIAVVTVTKDEAGVHIKAEEIPLKVKSAEDAFDLVVHEREVKEQKEAQEFVLKLKTEMVDAPKEDRIEDEINLMNLDKKILDKVNYYLTEAHLQKKVLE
jgi:exonuclease SbcD